MKFRLFVELVFRFFFAFGVAVVVLVFGIFLLGLGSDEAVEVGLGGVEFKRGVILFEQLAHTHTVLYVK